MAKATKPPVRKPVQAETPEDVKPPVTEARIGYVVIKPFRDKDDFNKVYSKGIVLTGFEEKRLTHLIKIGHVKQV